MKNYKFWLCLCLVSALLLGGCAPQQSQPPETTAPVQTTQPTTEETTAATTEETTVPALEILEFGYDGDYLTCLSRQSILGIDVSKYQGEIDWQKVKAAGVEFVMIRIGYRGYGQAGTLGTDAMAQENYQGAKEAGLKVGGYFFSQAITTEEAIEEAQYVMNIIDSWQLDMPLVYDWECLAEDYRTMGVDARLLTDCTKAFCDTVKDAGYDPMIYYNPDQSCKQMYMDELEQYGLWLAKYTPYPDFPYPIHMWQYTNQGSVPGIQGNVDINLYFPT